MQITNNKVVSLTYDLKIKDNGEMILVEQVNESNPFVFIHGISGLPDKFEDQLTSYKAGDRFEIMLSAEESGYGDKDTEAVVDLPKNIFIIDGKFNAEEIAPGRFVPMTDMEGNKMQGMVLEVNDEFVKMDFNHPLAGQDLYFEGVIVSVREATEEELDHGHVHGEGGHHH